MKTFKLLMLFMVCVNTNYAQNFENSISSTFSNIVRINDLNWTTKNLNVSHYRNGDPIPCAKTRDEWVRFAKEGNGCYMTYENDTSMLVITGKLYNWYAVNDPRGLAPSGFHIPSNNEWKNLIKFLNVDKGNTRIVKSNFGWGQDKVKKYGFAYQSGINYNIEERTYGNGNNSSGFSAIPAGYVMGKGKCYGIGEVAFWWSSTEINKKWAKSVNMNTSYDYMTLGSNTKDLGLSIRLIKD